MQTLFENLTSLNADDLNNYAISLAASAYTDAATDETVAFKRFQVSRTLRRMEESHFHEGAAPDPVLVALKAKAEAAFAADPDGAEQLAYRVLCADFDLMAA